MIAGKKAVPRSDGPSALSEKQSAFFCRCCQLQFVDALSQNKHMIDVHKVRSNCKQNGLSCSFNVKNQEMVINQVEIDEEEEKEKAEEKKTPIKKSQRNPKAACDFEVKKLSHSHEPVLRPFKKESEINNSTRPCPDRDSQEDWSPKAKKMQKNDISEAKKQKKSIRKAKKPKKNISRAKKPKKYCPKKMPLTQITNQNARSTKKLFNNMHFLISQLYYNVHSTLYSEIKPYLVQQVTEVRASHLRSQYIKKQVALFNMLLLCQKAFLSKHNLNSFNFNYLVDFLNFFSVSYLPQVLRFAPVNKLLAEEELIQIFHDGQYLEELGNWVKWYQANRTTNSIAVFIPTSVMGEVAKDSIDFYVV